MHVPSSSSGPRSWPRSGSSGAKRSGAGPGVSDGASDSGPDLEIHLIALEGGRLVGHVNVQRERHPVTHHVASLSIAVAADARGRGIGRRLMERAIAWSKSVGVEKLVLSVYPNNEAAISLYRSFGFIDEGRLARHSRKSYGYEDEILMAAWIGSDA